MIKLGPIGSLVKGHVLDVSKGPLERALQDFDSQLYVYWNPSKLNKEGCWELRRRPDAKVPVFVCEYEGNTYSTFAYHETGINHIKDFAYLNYSMVTWAKDHDIWSKFNFIKGDETNNKRFIAQMELRESAKQVADIAKIKADTKYQLMEHKKAMGDFRSLINSGVNPAELARHWK